MKSLLPKIHTINRVRVKHILKKSAVMSFIWLYLKGILEWNTETTLLQLQPHSFSFHVFSSSFFTSCYWWQHLERGKSTGKESTKTEQVKLSLTVWLPTSQHDIVGQMLPWLKKSMAHPLKHSVVCFDLTLYLPVLPPSWDAKTPGKVMQNPQLKQWG